MRLIYTATNEPVRVGDTVSIGGLEQIVAHAPPPRHASSSGKVVVRIAGDRGDIGREYFVGVIGAQWIEREDQA